MKCFSFLSQATISHNCWTWDCFRVFNLHLKKKSQYKYPRLKNGICSSKSFAYIVFNHDWFSQLLARFQAFCVHFLIFISFPASFLLLNGGDSFIQTPPDLQETPDSSNMFSIPWCTLHLHLSSFSGYRLCLLFIWHESLSYLKLGYKIPWGQKCSFVTSFICMSLPPTDDHVHPHT